MAVPVVLSKDKKTALMQYEQSLEDLTFNSKPLIDDLTRDAELCQSMGDKIVDVIQSRIMKVRSEWKLPSLYLLDSILKNIKGPYLEHVSRIIVGVFCHCFEKLTEPEPRKSLYKLRTTWPPFVSSRKLAAIDRHVHTLDPNWPITAVDNDPTGPKIFVNPKFVGVFSVQYLATKKRVDSISVINRGNNSGVPKESSPAPKSSKTELKPLNSTKSSVEEKSGSTTSIQDRRKLLLVQKISERREKERLVVHNMDRASDHNKFENDMKTIRARSSSPLSSITSPPQSSKDTSSDDPPASKRIKPDDTDEVRQSHLQLDDIPPELLPKHYENVLKKIERQIDAGDLTPEQRTTLVSQLNELYELQRIKDRHNVMEPSESSTSSTNTSDNLLPPSTVHLSHPRSGPPPPQYTSFPPPQGYSRDVSYRGNNHRGRFSPWPSRPNDSNQTPHCPPVPPQRREPQDLTKIDELLRNLFSTGIISREKPEGVSNHVKIPNLSLTPATLKHRYASVIVALHDGEPCSTCGLRFLTNAKDLYTSHLNWHYRINHQGYKSSQNWFMHPDDWLKFEELEEDDDNKGTLEQPPERESPPTGVSPSEGIVEGGDQPESCPVQAGENNEVCTICQERLEQFWEEEEEMWHFRNAVRVNPGGQLYHTLCYEDQRH